MSDQAAAKRGRSIHVGVCAIGNSGAAWTEAERLADLPAVHDALQSFSTDCTGDNGTCVVLAVMEAIASRPRVATNEASADDPKNATRFVALLGAMLAFLNGGSMTAEQRRIQEAFEAQGESPLTLQAVRDRINAALLPQLGDGGAA